MGTLDPIPFPSHSEETVTFTIEADFAPGQVFGSDELDNRFSPPGSEVKLYRGTNCGMESLPVPVAAASPRPSHTMGCTCLQARWPTKMATVS